MSVIQKLKFQIDCSKRNVGKHSERHFKSKIEIKGLAFLEGMHIARRL